MSPKKSTLKFNLARYCHFIVIVFVLIACNKKQVSVLKLSSNPPRSEQFSTLNMMPVPASYKIKSGHFRITKDFTLSVNEGGHERLYKAADRFLRRLDGRTGLFFKQGVISKADPQTVSDPQLVINAKNNGKVELNEDESYSLSVDSSKIALSASNDIGIIHGLETLLQLISNDKDGYYFQSIEINDKPRFPWRGLMIDVARHYMPIDVLKRNIDGMAAVKMNVLHLHLHDDHGWRVESKTFPLLHRLASDGLYYTHEQIKELVVYASDRGIRVIPEFDVPGHATSILTAYPELGSAPGQYKLERNFGVFNPSLNPTIDQTYTFLEKLFTEMAGLFPDPYFHIGGDENNGRHWKSNAAIKEFMAKNNISNVHELSTYFNNRIIKTIQKLDKKMVGWEEILQPGLTNDAIIHSWLGKESLFKAAKQNYKTILSNGFYIDLLYPASDHYLNDPLPDTSKWTTKEKKYLLTPEQEKLILGGEATMWSELVTPNTIDSRIWPRTAAIAERLWSAGNINDVEDMYRRLDNVSFRLEELGLTHISYRNVILRNLANGGDITPLKILADVIEPYKEYKRNNGNLIYKSYSPYIMIADAASADARDARIFRSLVKEYLKTKKGKEEILYYLNTWKNNHQAFLKVIENSPVLKKIEKLSEKLSIAATIGIEALEKTQSKNWIKEKKKVIEDLKADSETKKENRRTLEDGRTELMVLDEILILVEMAK